MSAASDDDFANHSDRLSSKSRKLARWFFVVFCLGALLGFIPTWFVAHKRELELDQTRRELRVREMQSELSEAALNAQRKQYEAGREEISRFFTLVQTEVDRTSDSAFEQERGSIRPLLNQRDEVITLLARSDPSSADRLSTLDLEFRRRLRLN